MEYADCPWNEDTKLARVSLATEPVDFSDAPASNIVFLIDTSGSMFDSNKLPLVQQSLIMLAENFTEKDRISIVTYAGNSSVELSGVTGDNYYEICDAIEGLEAYGSTNGADGIETAYELAEKYFIKGGNNRVILATDGDLNVGITSEGELTNLIKEKKKSGVFLSVIGVGYGNYKDNKLEALADNGDGTYAYIDSLFEARKTLVENLGASMTTVAKDVKLQLEFNPELVKGYRLIGYENRVMAAEEFDDDTKDGGEMGAGHTVTALYEIALNDSDFEIAEPELKYSSTSSKNSADELFTLNVRYKEPDSDTSKLQSFVCSVNDYSKEGSDNLRWAAAVAEFGLILRDSEYMGASSIDNILSLAESALDRDDEYKQEFIELVQRYSKHY
jgi:Ca-activated chloride channel family protein